MKKKEDRKMIKMRPETEAAWAEVRRQRAMLEQTLNKEQRRELGDVLEAWRRAHLRDVIEAGGEKIERAARKILGLEP